MLGNGAWNMRKVPDRWSWHSAKSHGNPSLFLQLVITHKDGTQSVISSDESWKIGYGAITIIVSMEVKIMMPEKSYRWAGTDLMILNGNSQR